MRTIFQKIGCIGLLLCCHAVFGQSRFLKNNQEGVDTVITLLKAHCPHYGPNRPITNKARKKDRRLIAFLNDFYNKDLSVADIKQKLHTIFKQTFISHITNLGGCVKYETRIKSEGNLDAYIAYTTFGDKIVFRRIYFDTRSKTNCSQPHDGGIWQDLGYLQTHCIPLIDFPLSHVFYSPVFCDTICFNTSTHLPSSAYKLFPGDSGYLNKMCWYDYDTYTHGYPGTSMAMLVKDNRIDIIYQLLYSPNHVLALRAMEALVFLKENNHLPLSPEIEKKMEAVKNASISINFLRYDVVRNGTYKEMKITKEQIINQYKKIVASPVQ